MWLLCFDVVLLPNKPRIPLEYMEYVAKYVVEYVVEYVKYVIEYEYIEYMYSRCISPVF